jgi:hypothetical protein
MVRFLSLLVLFIGVVAVVMGGVFIGLGASRDMQLKEAMRNENVTLGIESDLKGEVIDSLSEAMKAGDTIREHRRSIAPSYGALLGEGKFDPTNPEHLVYAQAMNLENYLYLAVAAFGLVQVALASGAFMLVTGVGLIGTGWALLRIYHTH